MKFLGVAIETSTLRTVNRVSQLAGIPLLVTEYVQDIYMHLWHLGKLNDVPEYFLQGQKVLPWMRAIHRPAHPAAGRLQPPT